MTSIIRTIHSRDVLGFLFTLLFIISSFCFNSCDALRLPEIFKLKNRMTLEDYNTQVDSLDIPTLDAYDQNPPTFPTRPLNQDYPPLIAPTPSLISPTPSPLEASQISNPPVYGSTPIASPHYGPTGGPAHNPGPSLSVWCVAKPTIPDPLLQRAMDYACGAGADCGPVKPNGICFGPNTLIAHASYAFNSYWQRTKSVGGTCDFGGTAMLINVDPSFLGCHFMYN